MCHGWLRLASHMFWKQSALNEGTGHVQMGCKFSRTNRVGVWFGMWKLSTRFAIRTCWEVYLSHSARRKYSWSLCYAGLSTITIFSLWDIWSKFQETEIIYVAGWGSKPRTSTGRSKVSNFISFIVKNHSIPAWWRRQMTVISESAW